MEFAARINRQAIQQRTKAATNVLRLTCFSFIHAVRVFLSGHLILYPFTNFANRKS